MNQTIITARELLTGDFLVLGNTTQRVVAILESETNKFHVNLANGKELVLTDRSKVTILDDDSDEFDDYGSHSSRDE